MTPLDITITVVLSVVAAGVGAFIGFRLSGKLFFKKTFGPENAVELLKAGRPEEWNEVRIRNPDWTPDLTKIDLSGQTLPQTNFSSLRLDSADLSRANLDGCRFDGASLAGAKLAMASLLGASFHSANLKGADLADARIERTSFVDADLSGTVLADKPDVKQEAAPAPTLDSLKSLANSEKLLNSLDAMAPRQFEEMIAQLFASQGYQVELTSAKSDQGFDVIVTRDDPLVGEATYLVEAKKYRYPVGVSSVRSLVGSVISQNANRGIIVTTSSFTKPARDIAQQLPLVQLIDGRDLANWILKGDIKPPETETST